MHFYISRLHIRRYYFAWFRREKVSAKRARRARHGHWLALKTRKKKPVIQAITFHLFILYLSRTKETIKDFLLKPVAIYLTSVKFKWL